MAKTRIWNVTDGPNPAVKPQNLRVLGKLLVPGQSMQVEESDLVSAHKVHADMERGMLYVGKTAPASYAKAKKPGRAKLADGVTHARAMSSGKVILRLSDKVVTEDVVDSKFGSSKKKKKTW